MSEEWRPYPPAPDSYLVSDRKLTMAGAMKVVELLQAGRRGAGV